jgi:ribosomal protein S18 acetylase RimI-like enzyme
MLSSVDSARGADAKGVHPMDGTGQAKHAMTVRNVRIRDAGAADVAAVTALDAANTGLAKRDYWDSVYARFGDAEGRYFLIAEGDVAGETKFLGFIVGEVRSWEFGSPPGGWVLTLGVEPAYRVKGVGTMLFDQVCDRLRQAGVSTVHTLLAREDTLNMAFFRAQGLMAGSVIELEKPLD